MLQKSLFWRIVGIDDQDVDVAKSVFSTLNLRHYGLDAAIKGQVRKMVAH